MRAWRHINVTIFINSLFFRTISIPARTSIVFIFQFSTPAQVKLWHLIPWWNISSPLLWIWQSQLYFLLLFWLIAAVTKGKQRRITGTGAAKNMEIAPRKLRKKLEKQFLCDCLAKIFWVLSKSFSAGLSKLHSICSEDYSGAIYIWKILAFYAVWWTLFGLGDKYFGMVVETAFY